MSTAWTKEKYDETLKQLYKKAATDEAFRKRCLKDAAGAIKEISGLDLPAGAKVRFVEKLEEQVFVLPNSAASELSEEELATVAGGGGGTTEFSLYCTDFYKTVVVVTAKERKTPS
jgi:hypothetical protein